MVNSAAEVATATAAAAAAAAAATTVDIVAATSNVKIIPRLTDDQLQRLSRHDWVVVPDFLSTATTTSLRLDLLQLREQGLFSVSKIGHDGLVQDEQTPFRDIRHSETCALNMMMMNNTRSTSSINPEEEFKQGNNGSSVRPSTLPPIVLIENSQTRMELYDILNGLRNDLQHNQESHHHHTELDETLQEVMYAYYPVGGYYKRHVDAEQYSASCWRQYSFLLYLNDATEWNDTNRNNAGGQLRLHRDSGGDFLPPGELPNFVDLAPLGGTLVIFRSNVVPHEVLPTNQEGRMAVVGWFLAKDIDTSSISTTSIACTKAPCRSSIHPDALAALRALREVVPGMKGKLEPTARPPPDHQSGLILDNDWGIVTPSSTMTTTTTTTASASSPAAGPDDTNPRYWKSIAAFDEDGHISTLSLGGQRLRKLLPDMSSSSPSVLLAPALWKRVVTVDLANTDLPVPVLCQVLEQIAAAQSQQQQATQAASSSALLLSSSARLTQLYLGGNGLGGGRSNANRSSSSGLTEIMPHLTAVTGAIISTLQVLDLRFNDLGPADAALLGKFLHDTSCRCEKLYLEGNVLGDEGAQHLANGGGGGENGGGENSNSNNNSLRELYLGANGIGPDGAAALAKGFVGNPTSRLEKLYLEGNCIGPEGARSFIDVLENTRANGGKATLQKLYVDNNNIGKKEAVRLGHALGQVTVIGETHLYQEDEEE